VHHTQRDSHSKQNHCQRQHYTFKIRLKHQVRRISVFNVNYPLTQSIPSTDSIVNMARHSTFRLCFCILITCPLVAQTSPGTNIIAPSYDALVQSSSAISSPLTQPSLTPGALLLLELEGRFAKAVETGGGKAFGSWFADDGVTLNNGKPAVLGRTAIAAQAQWDPKTYQLTWTPQGAQMGPSNDMGFTWGHYEGRSKDKNGGPVVITGRYFTVWKKLPDGTWKVALDASADEPPATGECCVLPKP
jgi:ketosteroid isomerase-like protein